MLAMKKKLVGDDLHLRNNLPEGVENNSSVSDPCMDSYIFHTFCLFNE